MRRYLFLLLPLLLAACTAQSVWAPDDVVSRAAYRNGAPPSITLVTMINNRSNEGAHSALLINASQRVVFDPAGSWWHRNAPERNDLHYGIRPILLDFYIDYHARETFHVVMQKKQVSPEVAEQALRLAQNYGAVPKAMCGASTSSILGQLPGFESIKKSWFPGRIMTNFAELDGVETVRYFDDDDDDNGDVLRAQHDQVGGLQQVQPNR